MGQTSQGSSSKPLDSNEGNSLLWRALQRLIRDVSGQDQVEYAVFIGVIALVAAMSLPAVANQVSAIFTQTEAVLQGNPGNCGNANPGNFQGRSSCAP